MAQGTKKPRPQSSYVEGHKYVREVMGVDNPINRLIAEKYINRNRAANLRLRDQTKGLGGRTDKQKAAAIDEIQYKAGREQQAKRRAMARVIARKG
jgi:hypothetical protein